MMKKLWGVFCFSGVWIPFAAAALYALLQHQRGQGMALTGVSLLPGIRIGVFVWMLHLLIALTTLANGKPMENYGLLDSLMLSADPYAYADERKKAQQRRPPEELLTKSLREGIVIGRKGRSLVQVPLASGTAAHTLICGITGSGKSSCCIIPTILCTCNAAGTGPKVIPGTTAFVFDIKKEIYGKAVLHDGTRNLVIDPDDRCSCGWDLFWQLRGESGKDIQTRTDVLSDICYTIIPPDPGNKNAFFIDGGRDLLFGLLLYHYNAGTQEFIDCVDAIAGRPMMDQVNEALNGRPGSIEYKTLVRFKGMDEKTFADVSTNAFNGLSLYLKDHAIRYMLRDNPRKLNPGMLEDHSVFLCMEDWHLENWAQIVTMLCNQTMGYILRRPEGKHIIMCVIDEWANIQQKAGRIKSLSAFLALGRSHGGCAVLVSQSLPALEVSGTKKEEVQAMLNNIPYKVILSAGDEQTQRWIISQAGKVVVTKHSNGRSGRNLSSNRSREDKDILDASLLMTLPREDRVVVLSTDYGFFTCNRAPYYKTEILKSKWLQIREQNQMEDKING